MLPKVKDDREMQKFTEDVNGEVAVRVVGEGQSLLASSSDTILLDGESFDTGIIDTDGFRYFFRELYSDQNGTLNGYWYEDAEGNNLVRTFTNPYEEAQNLLSDGSTLLTRYMRLVFTNDSGTDLERFHLRVIISNSAPAAPLVSGSQFLPPNSRGILTRSIISGFNPDGNYQNVRVNKFGALSTSSFILDVSRGSVPNSRSFVKVGRNTEINTNSDPEDIWNGGNIYNGQPQWGVTAETVEVFSSSSSDTALGIGAKTLTLYGLDETGARVSYTLTLNGTTPVQVPDILWSRLNYTEVETTGSNEFNVGAITARATTTTSRVFMSLPIGVNKTATGATTVPLGRSRSLYGLTCRIARASGAAGSANVRLLIREQGSVWRVKINEEITTESPFIMAPDTYIEVPELTDIKWQVNSVSDNSTIATCTIPWLEFDS